MIPKKILAITGLCALLGSSECTPRIECTNTALAQTISPLYDAFRDDLQRVYNAVPLLDYDQYDHDQKRIGDVYALGSSEIFIKRVVARLDGQFIEEKILRITHSADTYTVASGSAFFSGKEIKPYVSVRGNLQRARDGLPLVAAWQQAYIQLFKNTAKAWKQDQSLKTRQQHILNIYDTSFKKLAQWKDVDITPEAQVILDRFRTIYQ
jgi:hypothetical protein